MEKMYNMELIPGLLLFSNKEMPGVPAVLSKRIGF
jgi:hypothetical protein